MRLPNLKFNNQSIQNVTFKSNTNINKIVEPEGDYWNKIPSERITLTATFNFNEPNTLNPPIIPTISSSGTVNIKEIFTSGPITLTPKKESGDTVIPPQLFTFTNLYTQEKSYYLKINNSNRILFSTTDGALIKKIIFKVLPNGTFGGTHKADYDEDGNPNEQPIEIDFNYEDNSVQCWKVTNEDEVDRIEFKNGNEISKYSSIDVIFTIDSDVWNSNYVIHSDAKPFYFDDDESDTDDLANIKFIDLGLSVLWSDRYLTLNNGKLVGVKDIYTNGSYFNEREMEDLLINNPTLFKDYRLPTEFELIELLYYSVEERLKNDNSYLKYKNYYNYYCQQDDDQDKIYFYTFKNFESGNSLTIRSTGYYSGNSFKGDGWYYMWTGEKQGNYLNYCRFSPPNAIIRNITSSTVNSLKFPIRLVKDRTYPSQAGIPFNYIDLGFKDIYFGTCNYGANYPEESGEYLSWGELEEKGRNQYNKSNYKFYNTTNGYTKINVLSKDEDVIQHEYPNSGWRMPTEKDFAGFHNQFEKIFEKETVQLLNGREVKSGGTNTYKVTMPNGNSIYFPISGYLGYSSSKENDPNEDGYAQTILLGKNNGYLWTSSINPRTTTSRVQNYNPENYYAQALEVEIREKDGNLSAYGATQNLYIESFLRQRGLPVRPILEKNAIKPDNTMFKEGVDYNYTEIVNSIDNIRLYSTTEEGLGGHISIDKIDYWRDFVPTCLEGSNNVQLKDTSGKTVAQGYLYDCRRKNNYLQIKEDNQEITTTGQLYIEWWDEEEIPDGNYTLIIDSLAFGNKNFGKLVQGDSTIKRNTCKTYRSQISIDIQVNNSQQAKPFPWIDPEPSIEDDFIDIGLSVKWARYNKGYENTNGYGDYYQQSIELQGKERIPTKDEWQELIDNSKSWTLVSTNNVKKYVVELKNGATIEFPFNGALYTNGNDIELVHTGDGFYWTADSGVGFTINGPRTQYFQDISNKYKLFVRTVYGDKLEPKAIDLGLSVKWGNFNVGAYKVEDYGKHYYWGSINDTPLNKNTIIPSNITGNKDFDIATYKYGKQWRTPTMGELQELYHNCTWENVDNYNNSGVNGYLVTSNINNNSIFIPANGIWTESYGIGVGTKIGYFSSESLNNKPKSFISYPYFRQMLGTSIDSVPPDAVLKLSIRPVYGPIPTSDNHQAVDLGLTTGILWSKYDYGSSNENVPGTYIAWGEMGQKSQYLKSNYKYYNNSTQTYSHTPQYISQVKDCDIVSKNWGNGWHIPTPEEMRDLLYSCEWEWVNNGNTLGYRVSSKTTGASIFLPCTGRWSENKYDTESGYYQCGELNLFSGDTYSEEYALCFNGPNESDFTKVTRLLRYYGIVIRPCKY